mgnify:CR=1 FL=1
MEHKNERLPIFTERFRELQGERSNTEFAEFLEISRQTVGFYCNGDRIPDALTLKQIAEKCEVSVDWLLGLSNAKSTKPEIRKVCKYTGLSEVAVLTLNQWDNPFGAGAILDMFIRSDLSDAILESIVDLRDAYIQCIGEKKAIRTNEHGDPEGSVRNFSSILDIEELLANYSKKTGREFFLADINDQMDLLHSRISRLWEEFVSSVVYSLDSEDETL